VNAKDETVQSAYLIATSEVGDDPRLLDLTLANGADVGSLDSYDGTGLIRAADRGYTEIVARLLETDIDVDHVNRLGWTALLEAIREVDPAITWPFSALKMATSQSPDAAISCAVTEPAVGMVTVCWA
jgi:ankyrin repeat protein